MMRKLIYGLCVAALGAALFAIPANAQTARDDGETAAMAVETSGIAVAAKDHSGTAEQMIPWYADFARNVASDWGRAFGWKIVNPVTINLYTGGITMAVDSGFYSVTPMTVGQVVALSNQPTYVVRDARPAGPGGGDGGWIVGVNINFSGDLTRVVGATPPAETQGHIVHALSMAMIDEVGGPGGPAWFREGLADLLANSRVQGMNEVDQRASAWQMANRNGMLPSVAVLTQDWDILTGAGGTIADASYKVADQAVFFLSQKVGVPQLIFVLQRSSGGEDFESALQSVTGYNLAQLDSAYRVTMPAY